MILKAFASSTQNNFKVKTKKNQYNETYYYILRELLHKENKPNINSKDSRCNEDRLKANTKIVLVHLQGALYCMPMHFSFAIMQNFAFSIFKQFDLFI